MTLGERIKNERMRQGISQVELANKVGITKQNLYKYENDVVKNIPRERIIKIAEVLNVSPTYLMGLVPEQTGNDKSEQFVRIPVLRSVPENEPIMSWKDREPNDIMVPREWFTHYRKYCALRIHDDSMAPLIRENDILVFMISAQYRNGDIVLARLKGEPPFIRKIVQVGPPQSIFLMPLNTEYKYEMLFTTEEKSRLEILGTIVELRRSINED